jgi:hypothetical protein
MRARRALRSRRVRRTRHTPDPTSSPEFSRAAAREGRTPAPTPEEEVVVEAVEAAAVEAAAVEAAAAVEVPAEAEVVAAAAMAQEVAAAGAVTGGRPGRACFRTIPLAVRTGIRRRCIWSGGTSSRTGRDRSGRMSRPPRLSVRAGRKGGRGRWGRSDCRWRAQHPGLPLRYSRAARGSAGGRRFYATQHPHKTQLVIDIFRIW